MEDLTREPLPDVAVLKGDDEAARVLRLRKRGADLALRRLATVSGPGIFRDFPALWDRIVSPLTRAFPIQVAKSSGEVIKRSTIPACVLRAAQGDEVPIDQAEAAAAEVQEVGFLSRFEYVTRC